MLTFSQSSFHQEFNLFWSTNIASQAEINWKTEFTKIENSLGTARTWTLINRSIINGSASKVYTIFLQLIAEVLTLTKEVKQFSFTFTTCAEAVKDLEKFVKGANLVLATKNLVLDGKNPDINHFPIAQGNFSSLSTWIISIPMAYSIETLNLSGIGLTILPDELKWFFITVKTFNLSRNRLSTIPQWIEKFEHLEKLNLSDNPDLKELPFSIFSLKEHCVINLFGTPLHSRFPQGELSIENMKQTCLSII